jgi:uncharacterized protein DUF1097
MDVLTALGVSIGVLIAVWTYLAVSVVALPVWVGIITWGAFFAAGGKTDGLIKTIAASLSGLVWAFIAITLSAKLGGGTPILALLVGVIAFGMVIQSRISVLSFIPGAFLGAASTVGAGATTDVNSLAKIAIALVAGAVFGYVSEVFAGALTSKKAPAAATT